MKKVTHLYNTRLPILWHLQDTPRPYFSGIGAKSLDLWEKVFQKVCVTGLTLSGTGKTSLVKNLVRFYENDGIYINGVPLNRISITKLRSKMVYISQQGAIANGSLEDNIFMGEKYDDDMKKVIASLPFMSKFVENGKIKDMTITDSGSNLSGGDKQKIIVSRLFLQDPDVIILDEITSSMDKETSEIVYESIFNRFNDKIIIIISHVDNVIKYTNKIWRLEKKHIVQSA